MLKRTGKNREKKQPSKLKKIDKNVRQQMKADIMMFVVVV